ncbi:T23 [Tupaiid betaherpesvirus 1]|uniref:T23 n=1 Tax=Tupaiid herpesvirus 1 (strain 1) TaxID=10397 RepID=Q91TS5_TUHV1|nr:T23 [Tupaiid betaherpesvirus 1]AAK57062.1 T23 [Tupaiid betaherpesvirus 1]
MAPPSFLLKLLKAYEYVDVQVVKHAGRRVRLPWPKNQVLRVGRRWRQVRTDTTKSEEQTLATYLCCTEELKLVGSVCLRHAALEDEDARPVDRTTRYPELYVGVSGRMYVYVCTPRTEFLLVVASDPKTFTRRGFRGCVEILVPISLPADALGIQLAACQTYADCTLWRNEALGQDLVLGDRSKITVCELYITEHDPDALAAWACLACTDIVTVIATVRYLEAEESVRAQFGPLFRRLVVLLDWQLRVYAARYPTELILLADNPAMFVARGLTAYHHNRLFFSPESHHRQLSRVPCCPSGLGHGEALI